MIRQDHAQTRILFKGDQLDLFDQLSADLIDLSKDPEYTPEKSNTK